MQGRRESEISRVQRYPMGCSDCKSYREAMLSESHDAVSRRLKRINDDSFATKRLQFFRIAK